MSWGPFLPDLDWPERKAQLRSLRMALRLLTGDRGKVASLAVLQVEIAGAPDADLLEAALSEFDRLSPVDRRRVLASFAAVLPPCSDPELAGRAQPARLV